MITPRLHSRALRGAFQWRLLALWWASLLLPGALAAIPVAAFLRAQLDHSPEAATFVARLDGPAFIEILRQLGENGAGQSIGLGLLGAALAALFLAPLISGATVAAARSDEPLSTSRLLAAGADLYGRMLRTFLAGLIPLAIGGGLAALVLKLTSRLNETVVWERTANRNLTAGVAVAGLIVFAFHLLVDAARAQFAADPGRRSGMMALWAALRMILRRPVRALTVGALGAGVGLGIAAVLMALRLQIGQSGMAAMALAWLLAQGAHVAVGWGRAVRIFGLADLANADAADRARSEGFRMEPPASSPPPEGDQVVHSTTLDALEPPRSGAAR